MYAVIFILEVKSINRFLITMTITIDNYCSIRYYRKRDQSGWSEIKPIHLPRFLVPRIKAKINSNLTQSDLKVNIFLIK